MTCPTILVNSFPEIWEKMVLLCAHKFAIYWLGILIGYWIPWKIISGSGINHSVCIHNILIWRRNLVHVWIGYAVCAYAYIVHTNILLAQYWVTPHLYTLHPYFFMSSVVRGDTNTIGKKLFYCRLYRNLTEPEYVNGLGAQESIPRKWFRQPL
jgi:hypothetical protein